MAESFNDLMKQLLDAIKAKDENLATSIHSRLQALQQALGKANIAYIVNLTDELKLVSTSYRQFYIYPCEAGERYHVTTFSNFTDRMDMGDNRVFPVEISAEDIARDVERMANSDIGEGESYAGVFFSYTAVPDEKDLAEAQGKLSKIRLKWIAEGDASWARYHKYETIPDYAKKACQIMRLDREWASIIAENVFCPACGNNIKKGTAICGGPNGCGAILDEAKARQFFPDRFKEEIPEPEPVAVGKTSRK
jgi:hypothetical protein